MTCFDVGHLNAIGLAALVVINVANVAISYFNNRGIHKIEKNGHDK